jgi:hypothetical protein
MFLRNGCLKTEKEHKEVSENGTVNVLMASLSFERLAFFIFLGRR